MLFVDNGLFGNVNFLPVDIFKSICLLLAGIGVFLLGMKLMSDGLASGASRGIKKTFARIGNNRFVGIGIGAGTTALIQSSSATTVMVVGFVNAGVMTLFQATAIIMGANMGTTVTAFLGVIADLPVASVFMALGFVSVFIYMFSNNKKLKCAGEIVTGLAIIFVGMHIMGSAFKGNAALTDSFTNIFVTLSENPIGPLLSVLIGAVFTGIVQSSSATTVMVVDLAARNIIPLEAAFFIVLGANIGTCVTALLASIGTTANAKRAAIIHLIFNLVGTLLFVPFIWVFKTQFAELFNSLGGGNAGLAVSFFHLFFNLITVLCLMFCIKFLVKLVMKIVPNRDEELQEPKLCFINENADTFDTELVVKEIINMANLARENITTALNAMLAPDVSNKNKIINTEQRINYINKGISRYLVKFNKQGLTEDQKKNGINKIHPIVSDLERIGDHAMEFLHEASEMKDNKIKFSEAAIKELQGMFKKVDDMFEKTINVVGTRNLKSLPEINALENEIDEEKNTLASNHIARLNNGKCSVEGGTHFYAIITGLERIADDLLSIALGVKNPEGFQLEALRQQTESRAAERASKTAIYW